MAYIETRIHSTGKVTYRAHVRIHGMPPESASFPTRAAAKKWATLKENELRQKRAHIQLPFNGRERYLTILEINRLLDACRYSRSAQLYPIVVFALSTGARRREILNLLWSDIDFDRQTIHFPGTKNSESRTLALSQQLLDILHIEKKKRMVISPYIFPSRDGRRPAHITAAWSKIVSKAGLQNLRFHDLRHTAACHMAMNGASSLEIAAILGHKTLSRAKRYSYLSNSATAKVLKRMHEAIFGSA